MKKIEKLDDFEVKIASIYFRFSIFEFMCINGSNFFLVKITLYILTLY